MSIFNLGKKKPEEIKPISHSEMMVKFRICDQKFGEYIRKYEALSNKHLTEATKRKMSGRDNSDEVQRVAMFQARINAAEKRRWILSNMMENYEISLFEKEFLSTLGDMASLFQSTAVDVDDVESVSKELQKANERFAINQAIIGSTIQKIDSTLLNFDSSSGSDVVNNVAKQIDDAINRQISDAKLNPVESTPEDVARAVIDSLHIE